MSESGISALLERVPYADGSIRRRLISGAVLALAITFSVAYTSGYTFAEAIEGVMASPALIAISFAAAYALGTVLELLAEVFFLKLVATIYAGLFGSLGPQTRRPAWAWNFLGRWCRTVRNLARLIVERESSFRVPIKTIVSSSAFSYFRTLPPRVRLGFRYPLDDHGQWAFQYVLMAIPDPEYKRWAMRLIGKSRDVASVTTSLVVGLAIVMGGAAIRDIGRLPPPAELAAEAKEWALSVDELLPGRNGFIEAVRLEISDPAIPLNALRLRVSMLRDYMIDIYADSTSRTLGSEHPEIMEIFTKIRTLERPQSDVLEELEGYPLADKTLRPLPEFLLLTNTGRNLIERLGDEAIAQEFGVRKVLIGASLGLAILLSLYGSFLASLRSAVAVILESAASTTSAS